jgi:N-acylneuraminate cytidylyltransferase
MVNNKKKVYAVIPARSGSKGVVDKNIINLNGYPLIAYSIAAALKSELIDRVIVSTDSKEYAEIARQYGAEVPFIRPSNISGDKATDIQLFQHATNFFRKEEGGCIPEYFAHLRPTTPIRDPLVIDKAIKSFIGSDYSSLRSVHKMSDTSYKTFEIENEKLKVLFSDIGFDIESINLPRQFFPVTYNPNGYIDIVRVSMLNRGLIHGSNVNAFITDVTHEIDEKVDFEYLEFMINRNSKIIKQLFSN